MHRIFFAAGISISILSALFFIPSDSVEVAFNQKFIEGKKEILKPVNLDLENPEKVFAFVFNALDSEAIVYPSENYHYFIIKANDKDVWGNIHLGPEERERRVANFTYWSGNDISEREQFGKEDGLNIKKESEFRYSLEYKDKNIVFSFNQIPQSNPRLFQLSEGEIMAQRTLDESGFGFYLIYDSLCPHFSFVLDEERRIPDALERAGENIFIGRESKFIFYYDPVIRRKTLIGVNEEDVQRNNYYDGPFDQLADNYVKNGQFRSYIEAVYPSLNSKIDNYGRFINSENSRIAIAPYYLYSSRDSLFDIIKKSGISK